MLTFDYSLRPGCRFSKSLENKMNLCLSKHSDLQAEREDAGRGCGAEEAEEGGALPLLVHEGHRLRRGAQVDGAVLLDVAMARTFKFIYDSSVFMRVKFIWYDQKQRKS